MTIKWPTMGYDEALDFGFDWSGQMPDNDSIASTSATVVSAPTADIDILNHDVGDVVGVDDGKSTVTWLSGGTLGKTVRIKLTAVTAQDRTLVNTVSLPIRNK